MGEFINVYTPPNIEEVLVLPHPARVGMPFLLAVRVSDESVTYYADDYFCGEFYAGEL